MRDKFLFICTGNIDRSPTAEGIFKGVGGIQAKSAGTSPNAPNRLSEEMIRWSDKIFAMEEEHRTAILRLVPSAAEKTIVLGIPDVYKRDQPELKKLIIEKMKPFIPEPLLGILE